jgi:hypothetical protein
MTEIFAVFKKFSDPDQAKQLVQLFEGHGIVCEIVDNSPAIDITFSANHLQNEVQLKIKQSDFDKANLILEMDADKSLNNVDPAHYLFDFTNEELYDILLKPDEWNPFDYKLAQKILKERGQTISSDLLASLRKQRIDDLAKPERGQKPGIIIGYFLAIVGGVFGMFIGYHLWTFQKTLPNGEKVFAYSYEDRKHGRNIFITGIIIFPLLLILQIILKINQ